MPASLCHVDVAIELADITTGARALLQIIKNEWIFESLKCEILSGDTNRLLKYSFNDESLLIRIYGDGSLHAAHEKELLYFQILHEHGLAPVLHCSFNNGYCYGFIPGDVMTRNEMKDKDGAVLVVKLVARLHQVQLTDRQRAGGHCLFSTLKGYLDLINVKSNTDKTVEIFADLGIPSTSKLKREVDVVEKLVNSHKNQEMVFCHNDLSHLNIIYNKQKDQLHCIDYEFGFPNYPQFDIGNHFVEFAGVGDFDPSLYPTVMFQKWWIRLYLQERRKFEKSSTPVDEEELNIYFEEVDHFMMVSHLFWGVWYMMQLLYSNMDVDYLSSAKLRLAEYFKKKKEFETRFDVEL